MMHGVGHSWFGGWMWIWPVLGLVVAGVIVWLVVSTLNKDGGTGGQNAEEILRERYARGEIDEEEFRRRLAELRK